jgi:hypothetical protein
MRPTSLFAPLPVTKPAVHSEAQLIAVLGTAQQIVPQVTLALDFSVPMTPLDRLDYSYAAASLSCRESAAMARFVEQLERISLSIQQRNVVEGDQPFVFADTRFLPHYQLV